MSHAALLDNDLLQLEEARKHYGDSWRKRGGVGAFMMMARKWDRIQLQLEKNPGLGIPELIQKDKRAEGIVDDVRDLRRYIILVCSAWGRKIYHVDVADLGGDNTVEVVLNWDFIEREVAPMGYDIGHWLALKNEEHHHAMHCLYHRLCRIEIDGTDAGIPEVQKGEPIAGGQKADGSFMTFGTAEVKVPAPTKFEGSFKPDGPFTPVLTPADGKTMMILADMIYGEQTTEALNDRPAPTVRGTGDAEILWQRLASNVGTIAARMNATAQEPITRANVQAAFAFLEAARGDAAVLAKWYEAKVMG